MSKGEEKSNGIKIATNFLLYVKQSKAVNENTYTKNYKHDVYCCNI